MQNIEIFLEKCDECEFLFGVELQADLELLVWVIGVIQDLLVALVLCYSLLLVVHLPIGGWQGGG
jgi:hypothetical protein